MRVRIVKEQSVRLANPVTFTLTPLTIQAALDRGIIASSPEGRPEFDNSLYRAGSVQ